MLQGIKIPVLGCSFQLEFRLLDAQRKLYDAFCFLPRSRLVRCSVTLWLLEVPKSRWRSIECAVEFTVVPLFFSFQFESIVARFWSVTSVDLVEREGIIGNRRVPAENCFSMRCYSMLVTQRYCLG